MAYVKAQDGTELFFFDWEGGGPPVVLVHGWPLDSAMWEYQSSVLAAAGHRVIAYDRRGFGRSGQPWTGYDYDTLASDLNDVMTHCGVQGATLIGFSAGGGEVARYLTRFGTQRVAKAVLISAVTPYLLKTDDNPDGVDKSVFDGMLAGIVADRPAFLAAFGKTFFGAGMLNFSVSAEILHWAQQMALNGSAHATVECARSFAATDFRRDMASFTVPTLIIHGDADQTVPIGASGRRTARMIPGARLLEYAGAPHALTYTERERLNRDLLEFIGR